MNDKPQPPATNVIPIGKYKGRTVDEISVVDPQYLEWISAQPWFVAKYVAVHQTIINRGAESEETPEHNSIQVKFLDDDFCLRILRAVMPNVEIIARTKLEQANEENCKFLNTKILDATAYLKKPNDGWRTSSAYEALCTCMPLLDQLQENPIDATIRVYRQFEKQGIDAALTFVAESGMHTSPDDVHWDIFRWPETYYQFNWHEPYWKQELKIEIKPTIGDDYPAVLRQMRRTESDVLVVGSYTGQGATREQFVATMRTAGITVVFLADI